MVPTPIAPEMPVVENISQAPIVALAANTDYKAPLRETEASSTQPTSHTVNTNIASEVQVQQEPTATNHEQTYSQAIWQSIGRVAQTAASWLPVPQSVTTPVCAAAAVAAQGVRAIVSVLRVSPTAAIVPNNENNPVNDEIQKMLANRAQQPTTPAEKNIEAGELSGGIMQDNSPAITFPDQVEMVPTARTAMPDASNAVTIAPSSSRVNTNKDVAVTPSAALTKNAAPRKAEKSTAMPPIQPAVIPAGNISWPATIPVVEPSKEQTKTPEDFENFVARTDRAERGLHQSPVAALAKMAARLAAKKAREAAENKEPEFVYAWQNPDGDSENQKEAQSTSAMPTGPGQKPPADDEEEDTQKDENAENDVPNDKGISNITDATKYNQQFKVRQAENAGKIKIDFHADKISHIFRDIEGHLLDTPANRKALLDMASDPNNYFANADLNAGNLWCEKILPDGTQLWAQVRDGQIRNGGLNLIPKIWNPATGLSRNLIIK